MMEIQAAELQITVKKLPPDRVPDFGTVTEPLPNTPFYDKMLKEYIEMGNRIDKFLALRSKEVPKVLHAKEKCDRI